MLIPSFTEEHRQELLRAGRQSLYYFGVSLLGFDAYDPSIGDSSLAPVHTELACFLEGRHPFRPWNRGLVCCSRGLGKSTWTTQIYPLWRTAYIDNFVVKLVENSSDNAKINHFLPMVDLFVSSKRADFLQWLYQHRIPDSFDGWSREAINWKRSRPGPHSISYWGTNSKFEGAHPDLFVLDDLEGADAETSIIENQTAESTYQRCIPMLRDPRFSQILVVGTPWGPDPIVYKLRAKKSFQVFWREMLDEDGKSRWPIRFPPEVIEQLKEEQWIWDTQYMLRKQTTRRTIFNMDKISENFYTIASPGVINYSTFDFDPETFQPATKRVPTWTTLQDCYHFVHVDPKHRTEETLRSRQKRQRPALAGISVVSVAPDGHAFVTETWEKDADMDEVARRALYYYCLYAARYVTFEGIGAQVWLRTYIQQMEKIPGSEFFRPRCLNKIIKLRWPELPLMSTRLVEAAKKNEAKDMLFRESLSPWLNSGILHLHKSQDRLLFQLKNVEDESVAVDIADSLTQGAGVNPEDGKAVWRPPMSAGIVRQVEKDLRQAIVGTQKKTGYYRPWGR